MKTPCADGHCEKVNVEDILTLPQPFPENLIRFIETSMDGLRRAFILMNALRLGVFDFMRRPTSSAEIADKCGLNQVMAEAFCDDLCFMGLLEYKNGSYVSSPMAITYLTESSLFGQLTYLKMISKTMACWQELDQFLTVGPQPSHDGEVTPANLVRGMGERALCGPIQNTIAHIRDHMDLTGSRTLLDLGGGHGLYSIAFCALYPDLHASVFDRPEVVPVAKRFISLLGATNVEIIAGDFTMDDIGRDYDIIFSSDNPSGTDPTILPVIRQALAEDGIFIVRNTRKKMARGSPMNIEMNFRNVEGKYRKDIDGEPERLLDYLRALGDSGFDVQGNWEIGEQVDLVMAKKISNP